MSSIEVLLVIGVLIPLGSFLVLALFGARLGKPLAGWVAVAAIGTSCVLATVALFQWHGMNEAARLAARSAPMLWAKLGSVPITFGVNLDSLTLIMFFMVSFVSTWIFVFSVGYMAGHSDEIDGISKFHRFFTYLSLFCFSMLLLVIADSLLLLFIAWELVGLCSYLLIGFYFHKQSASNAAIKAFVTNRVGDFGFIIGLGMVLLYLGNFSLSGAAQTFRDQYNSGHAPLFTQTFLGVQLATWMGLLLFCGAIGKSAQFPLHVWLPDAMEGPTPVSALIHAATMVAAGVYLTARIFVLLTPGAQLGVAVIGCITLTLGALIAIVQTDIKKVLAYSTISQLGYMMLGMGVGAWIAALFHLLTHAFFKALMFLGSGQVIEGCHHEQDIRKMGGLIRKMPFTAITFLVGVLAIAGVGIPMLGIGLGGYFSKDEILAVAWDRTYGHQHAGLPVFLFWLPVLIAYVTPFYMLRCWWLTFMGQPRDKHVYDHAHESKLMFIPLVVLALGTFFASYCLFRPMVAEAVPHIATQLAAVSHQPEGSPQLSALSGQPEAAGAASFVIGMTYDGEATSIEEAHATLIDHHAHQTLAWLVGGAFLVGFAIAWLIYRKGLATGEALAKALRPLHTLLLKKFYFDEAYGLVLIGGTLALRQICYWFDQLIIDGAVNLAAWITERVSWFSGWTLDAGAVDGAVNGVGRGTMGLGGIVRRPQDGRIRNYILFAAGGVAVAVIWMAFG
jgi:NADH-quinone oxidoreductase subunit L